MVQTLLLFDVDGTLTEPRLKVTKEMTSFLADVRSRGVKLAVVGGSDLVKITEQLADDLPHLLSQFDYVFSENGVIGFKAGQRIPSKTMLEHIGEELMQDLINFALNFIAQADYPKKRGNFIEFRKGMLNFSPIGRSCSQEERMEFVEFDKKSGLRKTFVEQLNEKFNHRGISFAIGGQISVDAFPTGWDKTLCLQHLVEEFEDIRFFGDKTAPGGNDHEIFEDSRTKGNTVNGPSDTMQKIRQQLGL